MVPLREELMFKYRDPDSDSDLPISISGADILASNPGCLTFEWKLTGNLPSGISYDHL